MQPKTHKGGKIAQDEATAIATQALAYVAGDEARLGRFLAESGLGPETLRTASRDQSFLPAVLEFILSHDEDVAEFAAHAGIDAKTVRLARDALAGPASR
jgi:Protein of unknown function (DUF3572)